MRIYQKTLLGVLTLSIILYSFLNIFKTGINWDSVFDLNAANSTMKINGTFTLAEAYESIPLTSEFYGIFVYQLANFLHILLFFKELDISIATLAALRFINATSFLLTLISTTILTFTIYKISKSQRLAYIFFLISITSPSWVGMSQINTKDMPFAAGLTILTSGVMMFLKSSTNKSDLFYAFLFSASGSFIAVGTRAGGLILVLGILIVSIFVYLIKNRMLIALKQKLFYATLFICSTLGTMFALLLLTNPLSRIDLLSWLKDSFTVSAEFPSIQPVKALGQDLLSNQLPIWYVPSWIFAQLPILLFITLLIGAAQILYKIIAKGDLELFYFFCPLSIQGLLYPLLLTSQNTNMYNGIRHVYFIFPLIFLIAAYPLSNGTSFLCRSKKPTLFLNISTAMLVFLNIFALVRWMPYSYAFINPIAGLGETRNWDLDYWGVTAIEGVNKLRDETGINEVVVMPDSSSSIPVGSKPFSESSAKYGLYVYIHWNHKILEEKCDIHFKIKRDNQTLGMGGIC